MWRSGVFLSTVMVCLETGISRNASTICKHRMRSGSHAKTRAACQAPALHRVCGRMLHRLQLQLMA